MSQSQAANGSIEKTTSVCLPFSGGASMYRISEKSRDDLSTTSEKTNLVGVTPGPVDCILSFHIHTVWPMQRTQIRFDRGPQIAQSSPQWFLRPKSNLVAKIQSLSPLKDEHFVVKVQSFRGSQFEKHGPVPRFLFPDVGIPAVMG